LQFIQSQPGPNAEEWVPISDRESRERVRLFGETLTGLMGVMEESATERDGRGALRSLVGGLYGVQGVELLESWLEGEWVERD